MSEEEKQALMDSLYKLEEQRRDLLEGEDAEEIYDEVLAIERTISQISSKIPA